MWCGKDSRGAARTRGPDSCPNPTFSLLIEHNSDRPVVRELDGHPRAEDAARYLDPSRRKAVAEAFVERLRLLGTGGVREAGPIPLGRVGDQRELADDERSALDVEQAPVELAVGVLEDPQPGDPSGK